MNVTFFKITPSGSVGSSTPIGTSPKFEITDSYVDTFTGYLGDQIERGNTPIEMHYNEETKELLVWDSPLAAVPA